MAELLGTYFIATHQQVGDFIVRNVNGRIIKQGGNVASYFCTPDGRVIHAALGPVKADELTDEAQWAVRAFQAVDDRTPQRQVAELGAAHRQALLQRRSGRAPLIHRMLADNPLPPLKDVYQTVFTRLLRQRLSDDRVVEEASESVRRAKHTGSPLLLIFHGKRVTSEAAAAEWERLVSRHSQNADDPLPHFARRHVLITAGLEDMPALSRQLGTRPYAAPSPQTPLFVVAKSTGEQVGAVTSWIRAPLLAGIMAEALLAEAAKKPSGALLHVLARCPAKSLRDPAKRWIAQRGGRYAGRQVGPPLEWEAWHARYEHVHELSGKKQPDVLAAFSTNDAQRRVAAVGVARASGWYVPSELIERLGDASAEVREEAHLALVQLAGKDFGGTTDDATERAAAVVQWRRWKVGQEFIKEYARRKSAGVVADFTHKDSTVRWGAIHVARSRRLYVPEELIARLTDAEGLVRSEAHLALKQLAPGKDFGLSVQRWTEHFVQQREEQAQSALTLAVRIYNAGNVEKGRERFRDVIRKHQGTQAALQAEEWLAQGG